MRTMILAALVAMMPIGASADDFNGHDLHEICKAGSDEQTTAYVTGYLAGMIVGEEGADPGSSFRCIPKDVNGRQVRETVCRYVGQHPELRSFTVRYVAHFAVEATWPCKAR